MLFSRQFKLLVLLLALAILHLPAYVSAQTDERIPVCGIVTTAEAWGALTPAVSMTGQSSFVETYYVKKGLHFNCAAQLRTALRWVEETNHSYWEADHLTHLPTGRAVPDTIDPANGDQQFIYLSVDAPGTSSFAPCYPGANTHPTLSCPASYYNGGSQFGTILHRSRNKDTGFFEDSPWVVSRTSSNPPFVLRQVGTCANSKTGCQYEIKFTVKGDGTFSLDRDVQVLIQIPIHLDTIPETGDAYNSTMVIPLLIKHTAKPIPNSTPTPGGSATATPQSTSAPSGNGSEVPGEQIPVPADTATAKIMLDSIKKLVSGIGKGEVGASSTFSGTLNAILKTPGLTTKQLKALQKVNKALEKLKTFIASGATGKNAKTKKKALQTALKDSLKNATTGLKPKKK